MKKLDYAIVEHVPAYRYCNDVGTPKYAIDWGRNEEKFKITGSNSIRVYQGGRLEIVRTPYRDTDLKSLLRKTYDVDFRLSRQETQGIKFFTPDGRPMVKNSITDDMILLDHEHKMALLGHRFHYVEHGYAPKSDKQISVKLWQPEKEEAFLEKWCDTLKLGITMAMLADVQHTKISDFYHIRNWLRQPEPLDAVTNKSLLECIGVMQLVQRSEFNIEVREICAKSEPFDYLRIEEK